MSESTKSLNDRRILITGGTAGIGRAAALKLAELGASVIIIGRDLARGQQTVAAMQKSAPGQAFDFLPANLQSMAGTREAARQIHDRLNSLDVLINNAGSFFLTRRLTDDGYERTFALNHLSPFLLTHLMLDLLRESDDPRIITTASGAHFNGSMPLDDLQLAHGYSGFKAYSQSKLANVMFTYELDRRLEGTASANCFHPGWVATRIGAINPLLAPLMRLLTLFGARSPEQGAATAVQLALEAEGGQISGRYWFDGQPARTSKLSYDRDLWRRLWRESERLVGLNSDLALPEPTA